MAARAHLALAMRLKLKLSENPHLIYADAFEKVQNCVMEERF
jgi:hypothetical protein